MKSRDRTQQKKTRRRPGRFRRWILRPAVWIFAAALVLFAVSLVYLESAGFADRLRREGERRLGAALGREVSIGRVELDLAPPTMTVEEVSIAGPEPGAPPLFELERGSVEIDPAGLFGRRLELRHVFLLRPRLAIGFDPEGRSDLPEPALRRGAAAEPVELAFGAIEIAGGELVLDDERTPIDLAARDLEAVFAGVGDGIELRGRALAPELGLVLPPGRLYEARVELHGVLRAHRFDILRLALAGPDLDARADGYWRWQGDRELAIDLAAEGDLAVLGRLGYLDRLLSGPFALEGRLTRKPGIFVVESEVESSRAVVFDRLLTDLAARVRVDTNTLAVEILRGRHGNGGLTGTVDLGLAVEPGRVDLDLRLDRVRLARLLTDLGIPTGDLSGAVSGSFSYQFDDAAPDAGNGWADLVVTDESSPPAGELPVTGTVPLTIGGGVVRSEALRLTAPGFRLVAAGDYDLAAGRGVWELDVDADEVVQVLRLVPAEAEAEAPAPWRPTAGRGRAGGRLTLAPGGAALRLVLDLAAVEAPGLRADGVTGVVAIDGAGVRELRLEATRPEAALIVSGAVPFTEPAPGAAPFPFALAVNAASWPLEEARVWLPFEPPVVGPFTGVVELAAAPAGAGGGDGLSGRIAGRVAPVSRSGLSADGLTIEAVFDPVELRIERAELEHPAGGLAVAGTVGWEELTLDLELASTELDAGVWLDLPPAATAPFAARLTGRVGGRLEQPDVRARLDWANHPGDSVELEWREGRLAASGALPGIVSFEGGGALGGDAVAIEVELGAGRIAGLTALVAPEIDLGGEFAGSLRITGAPASDGSGLELAAAIELDRLSLELAAEGADAGLPRLVNLEPVTADLDAGGLELHSLYLGDRSGASELFVGGRVGAGGELDLRLQTAIATEWLTVAVDRVWPGARWSAGAFEAIAVIDGRLDDPRVNGVGEVRGARLAAEGLPAAIEDLSGTVLFYRDQIVVDSVGARLAGGVVRAGGVVPLGDAERQAFRFQAVGERLSYRSPEGWSARGDAEVVLAATPDGQQLSGAVQLSEVLYVKDVKLGLEQLLEGMFASQRLEVVPAEGWRAATQLNLRIEGERTLRVRNNVADLRASADLVVRGTLARPVVFGSVEVEPGGSLEYGGADYRIERGQLSFTNPYRIEPAIDLSARTELREYDVTLELSGTLDRLDLDFASNPPLADLDVLGLLSGSPSAALRGDGAADGESLSAQSFLYGQATELISQRFTRLFGLDKFRIDPLTSSSGDRSSARVTIGKRLTRNLSVTYSYDPVSTEEQVLELDWNVTRFLSLVLTQNGDGTYAVDALWERAF